MIIGITGGIGSGKSEVTNYLREKGEKVICADEVARQVVEPGEKGAEAIRRFFGDSFFDESGRLDRKKLADHVFENRELTAKLNDLLHPIIIESIFSDARGCTDRVFIDAALLIQSGMHMNVDYVWLVTADEEKRIERVIERDNTDRQSVLLRINNQLSNTNMIPFASEVIENNASISQLHEKIDELLQKQMYKEDDE
jgi:dephospho-CoA kinase